MTERAYPAKATRQELNVLRQHDPLTERHEQVLLSTGWDDLLPTFKRLGFTRPRRWFETYKRALKRSRPELIIAAEREESKLKTELSSLRVRHKQALDELDEATLQLEFMRRLDEVEPADISIAKRESSNGIERDSTVVNLFADWHLAETIEAKHVDGYNKYNPEIAELSVARVTESAIKMMIVQERSRPVSTLVAAYLGDMINGELHNSQATNSHHLADQAIWCQSLMMGQIDRLIDAAGDKRIVLIFVPGNHGRLTDKLEYSRLRGVSLEYMVYHALAARYADVDNVTAIVAESESVIQEVYGIRIRYRHGMEINYQGGVGGYLIPAYRMIGKWNRNDPCDYECFGHLHTFGAPPGILSCGSLCGFNARAKAKGYEKQPPYQAFAAYDSHYGRTIVAPLIVR